MTEHNRWLISSALVVLIGGALCISAANSKSVLYSKGRFESRAIKLVQHVTGQDDVESYVPILSAFYSCIMVISGGVFFSGVGLLATVFRADFNRLGSVLFMLSTYICFLSPMLTLGIFADQILLIIFFVPFLLLSLLVSAHVYRYTAGRSANKSIKRTGTNTAIEGFS